MSFGEILTEVVVLRAFQLHALKSSLLTGAEATAAEPWTAPLLRGCRMPEGAGGSWGNFPRKAALEWGFRNHKGCRFTPSMHATFACMLKFFNMTSPLGKF